MRGRERCEVYMGGGMIVIIWSMRVHFVFCFVWYVVCALFSSVAFQRVVGAFCREGL